MRRRHARALLSSHVIKTVSWPLAAILLQLLASNGRSRFLAFPPTAEQLQSNKGSNKALPYKKSLFLIEQQGILYLLGSLT